MSPATPEPGFRISIVPGVTPGKWVRGWEQRSRDPVTVTLLEESSQLAALLSGEVEMAFARLPVDDQALHVIPLYAEVPVAVLPRDHPAAELETLTLADVAEELLDTSALTARATVEAVASGAGLVVVPMSVARLYQRKDLVAVPVADAPETQVGLVWPVAAADPRIEEFIGVVRGRTVRSSRGSSADQEPQPKRSAAEKAAAKAARRPAPQQRRPAPQQKGGKRKPPPGRRRP
jgi:DNA-binding transcriptional LysR family regulator